MADTPCGNTDDSDVGSDGVESRHHPTFDDEARTVDDNEPLDDALAVGEFWAWTDDEGGDRFDVNMVDALELQTLCSSCVEFVCRLGAWKDHGYVWDHESHDSFDAFIYSSRRCRLCAFVACCAGKRTLSGFARDIARGVLKDSPIIMRYEGLNRLMWSAAQDDEAFHVMIHLGDLENSMIHPYWTSPTPPDLEDRLPTLLAKINECETNHPLCRAPPCVEAEFAARFLDLAPLGHLEDSESPMSVRLIPGSQVFKSGEPFAALSHCWGGVANTSKTTKENYPSYLEKIDFQSLPATFQDSIVLVSRLGVRYIWIDSLCIIQDDPHDWELEATKMASIYRGARFTISATEAEDSHSGLPLFGAFDAREPPFLVQSPQHFPPRGGVERITAAFFYGRFPGVFPGFSYRCYRINSRGWTLQEQLLSQRLLHVMKKGISFQCHESYSTEIGVPVSTDIGTPESPIGPVYSSQHGQQAASQGNLRYFEPHSTWHGWMSKYANRHLTYDTDLFAGIAGLSKAYALATGDAEFFGLWRKDLVHELCWNRALYYSHGLSQTVPKRRLKLAETVPSWSWLSLPFSFPGHLPSWSFLSIPTNSVDVLAQARVSDPEIAWTGTPYTSWPAKGKVRVTSLLVFPNANANANGFETTRGIRSIRPGFELVQEGISENSLDFQLQVAGTELSFLVTLDRPSSQRQPPEESDSRLLFLTAIRCCLGDMFHVLLAEKTRAAAGNDELYRRVGIGRLYVDFESEAGALLLKGIANGEHVVVLV